MKANFITATTKPVSILIPAPANNYFRDGSNIFKIKFEFLFSIFSVEDLEEELVSTEKKTFCAKRKCPKKRKKKEVSVQYFLYIVILLRVNP